MAASIPRTALVLGAGFTRAFLPTSPLMTDDYGVRRILRGLGDLPTAKRILAQELDRTDGGQINIERLLTRLDGGMPYDADRGVREEIQLLAKALKEALIGTIRGARKGELQTESVHSFARQCLHKPVDCIISFNYDDVLDEALYLVSRAAHLLPGRLWHPDAGYGFLCPSAQAYAHRRGPSADWSTLKLLKLHGSLNWRITLGAQPPYGLDALVHHEAWLDRPSDFQPVPDEHIDDYLEAAPFIVPPVLVTSSLVEQPILRRIWSLAHRRLLEAEQVIFIGYSLPVTDMMAGVLFRETLMRQPRPEVLVVNAGEDETVRADVRDSYRTVLPWLGDREFDFQGALAWSRTWSLPAG